MVLSKDSKYISVLLSFIVLAVYSVQRGLLGFSKSGLVPVFIKHGLDIFISVVSIGTLFTGPLLDNIKTKNVILIATIIGVLGLLSLQYGPWGFGLLFGVAALLFKVSVFSAPLKLFNSNEAVVVAPQAMAKNIGSGLFILFMGGLLISIGWSAAIWAIALFFGLSGIISYFILPDDRIHGWKINQFIKFAKQWKFWVLMAWFFFMGGYGWVLFANFIPAMIAAGVVKSTAITILATAFLMMAALRYPMALIGEYIGNFKVMLVALIGMLLTLVFINVSPVFFTYVGCVFLSAMTPNYWAFMKKEWGSIYIATLGAFAYTFMYLGTWVIF